MGSIVWLYTNPARITHHLYIMNSFVVFVTLLAAASAAPQTVVKAVNEGPQTGPATPILGNLVQTPKGLRPIDLEGFSEDLDMDGFVDPIVPAAPAPLPAPILRTVPAPVAVAAPAPVTVAAAPVAAPILRTVPTFATSPIVGAPAFARAPAFAPAPAFARAPFVASAPLVRSVVAAPAAPLKTISPLPVAFRAGPSAVVFDSRHHA